MGQKFQDKEYNEIIKLLREEHPIDEIVKFDNTNIQDKLSDNSFLIWKYKDLYLQEKATYDKINRLKEEEASRIFQGLRFPKDRGQETDKWIADRANNDIKTQEIKEFYIPCHPNIKKLDNLLKLQQARVDFFELCCSAIDKAGWNMKAFIQAEKIM
jgi:hypothetical protein